MSMDDIRRRFATTGQLDYDDAKHVLDQNRRYANIIANYGRQVQAIVEEARKPRTFADLTAHHIGRQVRVGRVDRPVVTVEMVRHFDGETLINVELGPLNSATACELMPS